MRLMKREKWMLTLMALFFAIMAVIVFIVVPAGERRSKLDRTIVKKQAELDRVLALRDEWLRVSVVRDETLAKIQSRGKDFAIFSYLENLAAQAGLKEQIQYMRPLALAQDDVKEGFVKKGLEVQLKGVGLKQLVDYLYRIEYSEKMLRLEYIRLKPLYTDPDVISATLRVVTYELA